MAPNRVVALAAPLIAPLAGAFAAWLSQRSGLEVPREAMEELFLAVSALVFGLAFQFNHNRYKWDALVQGQTTDSPAADADPLIDDPGESQGYDEDEFPEYDADDLDFEDDDEFDEPLDDPVEDAPALAAATQS